MINGPLSIDRGDGMEPTSYDTIQVVEENTGTQPRWIIYGTPTGRTNSRRLIAAYYNRNIADIIETDLLNGGLWYQHGTNFHRIPRF